VWPSDPIQPHQSWTEAARLYGEAAALFARSEETHGDWADCLEGQANCLRADNDPQDGDWAQAAALYRQAAELRGSLGQGVARAQDLLNVVQCHREGELDAPTSAEQRRLLDEAAELVD
jgi:hypothetical protein